MNFLLIGKQNVGKSSIFNILVGKNLNIVHDESGTTRDWHYEKIKNLENCIVFDTPGILIKNNSKKIFNINQDINKLLKKIDVFIYVVDYTSSFNDSDNFAINQLRRFNKKLLLIINKFDNYKNLSKEPFYKFGVTDIFFLSCSHKYGFKDFNSFLKNKFSKNINLLQNQYNFSLAIFGKPNVGKSTFLNAAIGFNRVATSHISGTTSDFVKDYFIYQKKTIKIIDTAGIVKKSRIKNKSISFHSNKKTFEKIIEVDFALILINAEEGLDRQDKRIINLITDKAKNIIIIFNKFDKIKNKTLFKKETILDVRDSLHQIKNIKIFFISSLIKKDVVKILNYLLSNLSSINQSIKTNNLNNWLKIITKSKTHPLIERKKVNFKYAVQVKTNPTIIKIYCNFPKKISINYKRFLIKSLNEKFNIINQKTKLIFSATKNPYL